MAKMRIDPHSGGVIFSHSKQELEEIKQRRQFKNDLKDVHRLKLELEQELKEIRASKKKVN